MTWLSLDPLVPLGPAGRDSVQGLPLPPALIRDYQHGGVFAVLGARTFDGASDRSRLLARAHPSASGSNGSARYRLLRPASRHHDGDGLRAGRRISASGKERAGPGHPAGRKPPGKPAAR